MSQRGGMSGHTSPVMDKDEWLTPPGIIEALGPFDLDPCSPDDPPWVIARKWYTREQDGLSLSPGRVSAGSTRLTGGIRGTGFASYRITVPE